MDEDSFVKWLIIHDLLNTNDPWGSNMFVVYDGTTDKFRMGPTWDYDNCYIDADTFALINNANFFLVKYLNAYDSFRTRYKEIFKSLTIDLYENIYNAINEPMISNYDTLIIYDSARWIMHTYTYENRVTEIEDLFAKRIEWIGNNI